MYCMNCGQLLNEKLWDYDEDFGFDPYRYCSAYCEEEDIDCTVTYIQRSQRDAERAEKIAYELERYVDEMENIV